MSTNFSFPPPPPPPPKAAPDPQSSHQGTHGQRGIRAAHVSRYNSWNKGSLRGGHRGRHFMQHSPATNSPLLHSRSGLRGSASVRLQNTNLSVPASRVPVQVSYTTKTNATPTTLPNSPTSINSSTPGSTFVGPLGNDIVAPASNLKSPHRYHSLLHQPQKCVPSSQQRQTSAISLPFKSHADIESSPPLKLPRGKKRELPEIGRLESSPSIPKFGFTLPTPTRSALSKPDFNQAPRRKKQRKCNTLGLTPNNEDYEASGDEIDDEVQLLEQYKHFDGKIPIMYNGKRYVLSTTADIAAWISERKKNFPTKVRIAQKRKELETKKALIQAQRDAAVAEKGSQVDRDRGTRKERPNIKTTLELQNRNRVGSTERTIGTYENYGLHPAAVSAGIHDNDEVKRRNQELAVVQGLQALSRTAKKGTVRPSEPTYPDVLVTGVSAAASRTRPDFLGNGYRSEDSESQDGEDFDDLSSVRSSSSFTSSDSSAISSRSNLNISNTENSDSAPEELSIHRTRPVEAPPPKLDRSFNQRKTRRHCRAFLRGTCRLGSRCKYLHKKPGDIKRVRLYEALVEQEKQKVSELAIEAIKYLGSIGFFV